MHHYADEWDENKPSNEPVNLPVPQVKKISPNSGDNESNNDRRDVSFHILKGLAFPSAYLRKASPLRCSQHLLLTIWKSRRTSYHLNRRFRRAQALAKEPRPIEAANASLAGCEHRARIGDS